MAKRSKEPTTTTALSNAAANPEAPLQIARGAIRPSINAAIVTQTFQGNLLGKEVDMACLVDALLENMEVIKAGDLTQLEAMLYAQATALQTMFSSLARRAHSQDSLKQYGTHMGFALKAQAQSRATIQTLIELKFPRQVAFVKQANISQGHQQINNGTPPTEKPSHAREFDSNLQNELLEAPHGQLSKGLDTSTPKQTKRSHSKLATVGKRDRTAKR